MARYGMLINTKKCIGCYACRVACQRQNNLLPTEDFIRYEEHEVGTYPNVRVETVPLQCMHCEDAPCVAVGPTGAAFIGADGIVGVDEGRCIGCKYCMAACPYGSRSFNFQDPRPFIKDLNPAYPTRMRGVVEKCTFCAERLEKGLMPACVEASNGAIMFGDLNDPNSIVRRVLSKNFSIRRKPDLGTDPGVYYII